MFTAKTLSIVAFAASLLAAPIIANAELPVNVNDLFSDQQPVVETVVPEVGTDIPDADMANVEVPQASELEAVGADMAQAPAVEVPEYDQAGVNDIPATPEIPAASTDMPEVPEISTDVPEVPEVSTDVPEVPEVSTDMPEVPEVSTDMPETPEVSTDVPETPEISTDVPAVPAASTSAPAVPSMPAMSGMSGH